MDFEAGLTNLCSVVSQKSISHSFLLAIAITNALLGSTAVIGNGLVVASYCCTPSLRTPSNILLFALAVTDFLTGLVVHPMVVAAISSLLSPHEARANNLSQFCEYYFIIFLTPTVFCGVSLTTLTATHFDKYLSVILYLRYKAIVTAPRVIIMEELLVIYVVVINVILRYSGVEHTTHTVLVTVGVAFCLILSCVSFIGIYRVVRRHQTVIQAQAQTAARLHGQPPLHIAKVKKSFRTFVLVWGVFLLYYGPYTGWSVVTSTLTRYSDEAIGTLLITLTVLFGNSTLNPVMLIFRMKDIRDAVLKLFDKVRNN